MFIKPHQYLFMFSLIISTIMSISAESWFTSWLALEINLMSMIPLILIKMKQNMTEAALKYFLAQALASLIMIVSIMTNLSLSYSQSLSFSFSTLTLAMLIKIGMAPLHFWFPQISEMMTWPQCMILFTWQKIAPLVLISFLSHSITMVTASISAMVGALGGLNLNKFKLILTYSSMAHSSWMVMASLNNMASLTLYFLIYSSISISLIVILHKTNTEKMMDINFMNKAPYIKQLITLNLLSLGGLPPLLGFTAKISILEIMMKNNMIMILMVLIISSLISLLFYLRMSYVALVKKSPMTMILDSHTPKFKTLVSISIFLNTIMPPMILLS